MEEITKDDLLGVIPTKGKEHISAFKRVKMQRAIFDRYGAEGVSVYSLIDGKKSAEEIRAELNMTPARIVEVLDFMDKEGVIQLKTIFEIEAEKSM
ncbi:MAG: hypothetical protein ACP5H8_03730 [Candidatus Micrarchaeia archaeon]